MKSRIALIGFMGSGKSTLGPRLAKAKNWDFYDLDNYIEKHTGTTISKIFAEQGEEHFRRIESQSLNQITTKNNLVLACGGGIILKDENVRLLKDNFEVIYLDVNLQTLKKRLSRSKRRPLLKVENIDEKITELYKSRHNKYQTVADLIIEIGEDKKIDEIVTELEQLIKENG